MGALENNAVLLAELPGLPERLLSIKETFLTNVVMVGEIPAPTFHEEARIRFLCDRFTESGLADISTDERLNATARLPGSLGKRNILVAANADSVYTEGVDHTVSLAADAINGVGLSDNGLGVAALVTLPIILDKLDVRLESNLILTAATRTLGVADMSGFNFFLDNVKAPIDAAVCLRGSELGRISYSSLAALRGQVAVVFAEGQSWGRQGFPGALVDLESVMHKILSIPVPQTPRTSIVLGSVSAGATFNTAPSRAILQFEIRSEEAQVVQRIEREIDMIIDEVDAGTAAEVTLEKIGRREPGALPFSHPLPNITHEIVEGLGLKPVIRPSAGPISCLIPRNIPAITIGLTERASVQQINEVMRIEPLFKGLAQLVTLLRAIDQGFPHEQD